MPSPRGWWLASGLAVLSLALPAPAVSQEIDFGPAALYPREQVETYEGRLVVADFNRDGRSDVAVAERGVPILAVRLAAPDGTLGPPTNYSANGGEGLETGDFNDDGSPDLLLVATDSIRVMLGSPSGSFAAPAPVASISGSVSQGDFNQDGDTDLAVAESDGTFSVLLGATGGSFAAPVPYDVADPVLATITTPPIIADFNADGDEDLALTGPDLQVGSRTVILLGGPGGSFAESARFGSALPIAVGDFNQDGDPDLAWTAGADVVLRLGSAGGGFSSPQSTPAAFLSRLEVTDTNGDGIDDLVGLSPGNYPFQPTRLAVLLGSRTGAFAEPVWTTLPDYTTDLVVRDLNGDADPDVAAVAVTRPGPSPFLVTYAGAEGATFVGGQPRFLGQGYGSAGPLAAGDLNGDGHPDLVSLLSLSFAFEPPEGRLIAVLLNRSAVDTTAPEITITSPPAGARYRLGQAVVAAYACEDPQSPVTACVGSVAAGAPLDTASVGRKAFRVRGTSAGGTAVKTHHYRVLYDFSGFLPPTAERPRLNSEKAGHEVKVRFGLGGDFGLDVLAAGSPRSRPIDCGTRQAIGPPSPTAGRLGREGTAYAYRWSTRAAWAGTCRRFLLALADGETYAADFRFR